MVREQKHRLPIDCYCGYVVVAFTACLEMQPRDFVDDDATTVIIQKLLDVSGKYSCEVAAWCLMPDHLHVILKGLTERSHLWMTMTAFKQTTGFWLANHRPHLKWQKDFYDHVIDYEENLETQIQYIHDNPVRAGLVENWMQYSRIGGTMVETLR